MLKEKTSDRLKKIMTIQNLKQVELINKCKPICEKYNKLYGLNIQITKSDLSHMNQVKANWQFWPKHYKQQKLGLWAMI